MPLDQRAHAVRRIIVKFQAAENCSGHVRPLRWMPVEMIDSLRVGRPADWLRHIVQQRCKAQHFVGAHTL